MNLLGKHLNGLKCVLRCNRLNQQSLQDVLLVNEKLTPNLLMKQNVFKETHTNRLKYI